jgi:hypothetical protein
MFIIFSAIKRKKNKEPSKLMNSIREHLPGTTVAHKINQGTHPPLGVLSGGGPFWVPFWASKKVQKQTRCV